MRDLIIIFGLWGAVFTISFLALQVVIAFVLVLAAALLILFGVVGGILDVFDPRHYTYKPTYRYNPYTDSYERI